MFRIVFSRLTLSVPRFCYPALFFINAITSASFASSGLVCRLLSLVPTIVLILPAVVKLLGNLLQLAFTEICLVIGRTTDMNHVQSFHVHSHLGFLCYQHTVHTCQTCEIKAVSGSLHVGLIGAFLAL